MAEYLKEIISDDVKHIAHGAGIYEVAAKYGKAAWTFQKNIAFLALEVELEKAKTLGDITQIRNHRMFQYKDDEIGLMVKKYCTSYLNSCCKTMGIWQEFISFARDGEREQRAR